MAKKNGKNVAPQATTAPETVNELDTTTAPAVEGEEVVVEEVPAVEGEEVVDATEGDVADEVAADTSTEDVTSTLILGEEGAPTATVETVVEQPAATISNVTTDIPVASIDPIIPSVDPEAQVTSEAQVSESIDEQFVKSSIIASVWTSNLRKSHGYKSVQDVINLVVKSTSEPVSVEVENKTVKAKLEAELDNLGLANVENIKRKIFVS